MVRQETANLRFRGSNPRAASTSYTFPSFIEIPTELFETVLCIHIVVPAAILLLRDKNNPAIYVIDKTGKKLFLNRRRIKS